MSDKNRFFEGAAFERKSICVMQMQLLVNENPNVSVKEK